MGEQNGKFLLQARNIGAEYNHVNSKGSDKLMNSNLVVEASSPHLGGLQKICVMMGLNSVTDNESVAIDLMLDEMQNFLEIIGEESCNNLTYDEFADAKLGYASNAPARKEGADKSASR